MATLHKFKLLASQCAVAGSPTQSPTTSPVIHLRRRKTLRMLLSRTSDHRRRLPRRDDQSDPPKDPPEKKRVRRKLKDLFVSSPPFEDKHKDDNPDAADDGDELLPVNVSVNSGGGGGGAGGGGLTARRAGAGALRPISGTFRYRLLRRAWRPVLVTIPE